MTTLLLDDHLVLRVLLGDEPPGLRRNGDRLATTGLWYHRLCRALAASDVVGSLSRRLGGVDPTLAASTMASVVALPDDIEMVALRSLGWPMAELIRDGVRLNLLSLEALAAARHLSAPICLAEADANEPLIAAAREHGAEVRIVAD